jgi:trigger factor
VQVTINTISPTEREAAFELSGEELQPHFDKAYEAFRPKAELKGFRKGKVPLPMIRKIYGEAIEHDALQDITTTLYRAAMEEREIEPIGTPSMVDMDFKRKEHLRFTIKYEVKPEITLGEYRGIAVEKPLRAVSDEEVEEEIHHLRRANGSTSEVDAVSDLEHIVTATVQELDSTGAPLIGKKTAGTKFMLSDTTLAGEIREALSSAKVGGTYRVDYATKHEDHTHEHHFDITVTGVQKVDLPPFDEALVRKLTGGTVSSPEEFRKTIRADLEKYWEDQATAHVNDALANEVVRLHDISVPESMVEAFLESFVEDVKNGTRDRRLPGDFDLEKFRKENRAGALWQAKWMLLKEAIAQKEHLSVTPEDLATLAEREASRIGIDKERLLEYYRKSASASDRLLSEKVMNLLRNSARVKEVTLDARHR